MMNFLNSRDLEQMIGQRVTLVDRREVLQAAYPRYQGRFAPDGDGYTIEGTAIHIDPYRHQLRRWGTESVLDWENRLDSAETA